MRDEVVERHTGLPARGNPICRKSHSDGAGRMKRTIDKEGPPSKANEHPPCSWWIEPTPLAAAHASLHLFEKLMEFYRKKQAKSSSAMPRRHFVP